MAVSPDGSRMAVVVTDGSGVSRLRNRALDPGSAIDGTEGAAYPFFSPDGRWVAYDSNESGRHEIYVRPFSPEGGAGADKWPVSTGGGERPRWRGDARELFYLGPDRRMMAVEVKTAGGFEAGIPKALFPTRASMPPGLSTAAYAVTADGQRFLINSEGEEAASQPATVVMNWTAGLRK